MPWSINKNSRLLTLYIIQRTWVSFVDWNTSNGREVASLRPQQFKGHTKYADDHWKRPWTLKLTLMCPPNSIEVSIPFRICLTLEVVSNMFKAYNITTIKTMFVLNNYHEHLWCMSSCSSIQSGGNYQWYVSQTLAQFNTSFSKRRLAIV